MAFSTGSSSGTTAEINVTPLIDVLLVLLIIFMVIVPLTPRGLAALLPQPPKDHTVSTLERPLVVDVSSGADGGVVYALNRQPLTKDELAGQLSHLLNARQNKVLFVRGDPQLEFSAVADVIGLGRAASAERIGILTPSVAAEP